jgi:cytochrome c oxidase subunit IV
MADPHSHHAQHEHAGHHDSVHHVGSITTYVLVFLALIAGTWITYGVAILDLGAFNAPIALIIATTKATLVVLFFMHVKDSSRLTKVTVAAGVFWLCILLTLTMTDFLTRIWH